MKANRLKHNSKWNSIQYWFWECTFEVFLCYYQSYDFSRHYATWNMNLKWKKFNQSQRWGCSMNMYDSKKYVWKNWIRWLRKKFGSTFFSRFCSIWILHFQRSMLSDIFLKHIKKWELFSIDSFHIIKLANRRKELIMCKFELVTTLLCCHKKVSVSCVKATKAHVKKSYFF